MQPADVKIARGTDVAIRISIVGLLLVGCAFVLEPFVPIIAWALVMAVALHPTYSRLSEVMNDRPKAAATLITIVLLFVFIAPAVLLSETAWSGVVMVRDAAEDGTLKIPLPPASIATWPLIGRSLSDAWIALATNLDAVLAAHKDDVIGVARWLVAQVASFSVGFLQIIVAVIVTGVLLVFAEPLAALGRSIVRRVAGRNGESFNALAVATTRSVARGVLGVALIQALLAGLGLLVAGVPGAGLWTMVAILTCTIQIGPGLVLIPAAIYLFVTKGTVVGVLFSVWSVIPMFIDNVLKPILLGRGVDTPMIVVVLGAIGGLLAFGVIGLFFGAILLVLGYATMKVWVENPGS